MEEALTAPAGAPRPSVSGVKAQCLSSPAISPGLGRPCRLTFCLLETLLLRKLSCWSFTSQLREVAAHSAFTLLAVRTQPGLGGHGPRGRTRGRQAGRAWPLPPIAHQPQGRLSHPQEGFYCCRIGCVVPWHLLPRPHGWRWSAQSPARSLLAPLQCTLLAAR